MLLRQSRSDVDTNFAVFAVFGDAFNVKQTTSLKISLKRSLGTCHCCRCGFALADEEQLLAPEVPLRHANAATAGRWFASLGIKEGWSSMTCPRNSVCRLRKSQMSLLTCPPGSERENMGRWLSVRAFTVDFLFVFLRTHRTLQSPRARAAVIRICKLNVMTLQREAFGQPGVRDGGRVDPHVRRVTLWRASKITRQG